MKWMCPTLFPSMFPNENMGNMFYCAPLFIYIEHDVCNLLFY